MDSGNYTATSLTAACLYQHSQTIKGLGHGDSRQKNNCLFSVTQALLIMTRSLVSAKSGMRKQVQTVVWSEKFGYLTDSSSYGRNKFGLFLPSMSSDAGGQMTGQTHLVNKNVSISINPKIIALIPAYWQWFKRSLKSLSNLSNDKSWFFHRCINNCFCQD